MTVTSLEELFRHELEDVYDVEHRLLEVLDELESQTANEQLKEAFRDHRQETEGHVDRLEEAFDRLGVSPEREECEGIEGLVAEHDEFVGMDPDQEILDVFNKTAAEKTEHYEIAAYGNLAFLADRLGEEEVGDILHENLEEEKAALEKLKDLSDDVAAVPAE